MSRGIGRLQRAILDYLDRHPQPRTFESLRWVLWVSAEPGAAPTRLHAGVPEASSEKLPTAWNTSLGRALKALAGQGCRAIALEKRHLTTLDEFVEHFPNKTLLRRVRSLRLELLSALAAWARATLVPRYKPGSSEWFYLQGRAPEELARFRQRWYALAPKLIALLPGREGEEGNRLFLLTAKGKSLFEELPIESRCSSFAQLLQPCLEAGLLPAPLDREMVALAEEFLPGTEAGFLSLKSHLHAMVHAHRHGRCELRDETLDYLDRAYPEVVRSLPGYRPAPADDPPADRFSFGSWRARAEHSEQIHALIDHTVFQKFLFISRPTTH
jgi:hypothetical protein